LSLPDKPAQTDDGSHLRTHTHPDAEGRVESLDTIIAPAGDDASAVWNRHPKASVHRHRKRLGVSDEATLSAPAAWSVRRLGDSAIAALGDTPVSACVTALHVLVQMLCDDEESVIGVLRASRDASRDPDLAASYVYAEAEDDARSVREQVVRCLAQQNSIALDHVPALASARNLPVFFVAEGTEAPSAPVVLTIDDDGAILRLGVAPEVRRFPDPTLVLESLETLLLALVDADREIGAIGDTIRDRIALPEAGATATDALARDIAGLWSELLGVDLERIQPDTSYFLLGGTSLNAFKLVAMVRSRFEVEINIREIIDHDTLAAFAAMVGRKRQDA
jgi:acyl carrier protein